MQRDPLSRQKALRAERRADEKSGVQVITIKPLAGPVGGAGGGGGGFKKGGFRNAFGGEEAELPSSTTDAVTGEKADVSTKEGVTDDVESESEDDGEKYDPRRPTGCPVACPGR